MSGSVYIGMLLGQTGIAIAFDNLWVVAMLMPFYLVIRFGVVARENAGPMWRSSPPSGQRADMGSDELSGGAGPIRLGREDFSRI